LEYFCQRVKLRFQTSLFGLLQSENTKSDGGVEAV